MHERAGNLHDPEALRHAGPALLSLALMHARNATLAWLAAFEPVDRQRPPDGLAELLSPSRWQVGHAGWFQEYWIARHVQRQRGARADAAGPRLASVEARADAWWHPALSTPLQRWGLDLPGHEDLRRWLADTFETTLDLLPTTARDDELHFHRAALWREDRVPEALAVLAEATGLPSAWWAALPAGLRPDLPTRVPRAPIAFGGQRWGLGSPPGGFVPPNERWQHEHRLEPFEIDAQPVDWARYAEFVADDGYDDVRWWTDAGRAWLADQVARHGPRLPRHVEQMRQGVLAQRRGRLQRLPAGQPVMHVTVHEAEAWCRWAGRRLPSEAEWELAACTAGARGFAWGDVWEWTAGPARFHPGHEDGPLSTPAPGPGTLRVLRGASWMTAPRLKHPRARRFAAPTRDEQFVGFRSCAV